MAIKAILKILKLWSVLLNVGLTCCHSQRPVTIFLICQLFSKAYGRVATLGNAVNGFAKIGIFPNNPLVFDKSNFQPAEVTNRPHPTVTENIPGSSLTTISVTVDMPSIETDGPSIFINESAVSPSFTSRSTIDGTETNLQTQGHCSSVTNMVTVAEISPLLKQIETVVQKGNHLQSLQFLQLYHKRKK